MTTAARAPRLLAAALVVAALLLALLPAAASAATISIRLEAGPQQGIAFDAAWNVVSSKTVTYSGPVTVTGSARRWVSGRGEYLRVTTGSLAGLWVREGRTAYIPGWTGRTAWAPARTATLPAGTYEVYHFDTAGTMTGAVRRVVSAARSVLLDQRAFVNGRSYVRIADGSWAGWWIPGSDRAPVRIGCTAGAPPAGTAAAIVRSVPAARGEIALTFDMGGRLTDAVSILRFLVLERVCATIFPTADAARTTVGRQVMAEIKAHPELFELGNHTVHHCNLRDGGGGSACPPAGSRPSAAFVTSELQDADTILYGLSGRHTTPYWRPPYGAVDSTLARVAAAAGYPYTMMWSTDTIDWRPVSDGGPTAAQIAAKVIAGRTAGGVVLMHLGGYHTRNALPAMLQGLGSAGYTATSVSALYRAGH